MADRFDTVRCAPMVLDLADWQQIQLHRREKEKPAEYELHIKEWEESHTEDASQAFVHQLFEAQVRQTPAAIALTSEELELTYQELHACTNQLAHYLQASGIGPGMLVGICIERSPLMVISILGVLKAGAGYVALDPDYPAERLAFLLHDARVNYLLVQHREKLPLNHHTPTICLEQAWPDIMQASTDQVKSQVTSRDIAYVIYTSGSTGLPKGVVLEHAGLCNMLVAQIRAFGVQAHHRVAQFASFSFDASVSELFLALLTGAQLCLLPQERRWPAPVLLHYLQEQAITTITLPPSVLAVLPTEELPALQTIISAGEELSAEIAARWSTGRALFNAYGPTEGTVCATLGRCYPQERRPSIGYPLPHTHIYLLDTSLRPVARGVVAEVYIGGLGLARGYLYRPALTAEKFLPDPFSTEPGARLYKTGDLARALPDGSLECLGRTDRMVKIRGFRIELGEIEAVLEHHPLVLQSLVTVYQGSRGARRLAAYVITRPEHTQGDPYRRLQHEMARFLQDKLPRYLLPEALVALSNFPLTPNGKIDRRVLPPPDYDYRRLRYDKGKP